MKESVKKLLNDSFSVEKEKVQALLDAEFAKPERERDYAKIDELVTSQLSLMGLEETVSEQAETGLSRLQARLHDEKPRVRPAKRIRFLMTAGIAAVMVLALNIASVAAFHRDIFSVVVEYAETSFSVKYPSGNNIVLPTTPDDPYGIKAECAKHGMDVLAPTYLPEGFELYDCKYSESKEIDYSNMTFWFYRDNKEVIMFTYSILPDNETHHSIPSEEFNLREIDIHGTPAIVSEEDGQYTVVFDNGNLETIISSDCGYDECDKITASLE